MLVALTTVYLLRDIYYVLMEATPRDVDAKVHPWAAQPFVRSADWHAGTGRSVGAERPSQAGAPRVPIVRARQPSLGSSQLSQQAYSSGSFPVRKRAILRKDF